MLYLSNYFWELVLFLVPFESRAIRSYVETLVTRYSLLVTHEQLIELVLTN